MKNQTTFKNGKNENVDAHTPEPASRPTDKIGSFMALRANGWSLSRISRELGISKSTAWDWDHKNKNDIHLLKHLQLEKLQEKYLPTYEEELHALTSYLAKVEKALQKHEFDFTGPERLMQMALQLRSRLSKMRDQLPLYPVAFNVPLEHLPFTGCVTRQNAADFRKEFNEGAQADPASNGNGKHPHETQAPESSDRTYPNENGGVVTNGRLEINDLQKSQPNGRSVRLPGKAGDFAPPATSQGATDSKPNC